MARRKRRTIAEHGPHPVDVHVGSCVHLRRTLLGMSLMRLAGPLGLTFQQVQKNERGFTITIRQPRGFPSYHCGATAL